MDNLQKVIRKLKRVEGQGFTLTFKDVVCNLYDRGHTVSFIQDTSLALFGVWKERKQVTRVIREYTKQSTLYTK